MTRQAYLSWHRVLELLLFLQNVEELAPIDQHLEKEHQEKTKVKNIEVSCCLHNHLCWYCLDAVKLHTAQDAQSVVGLTVVICRLLSLVAMTLTLGITRRILSLSLLKRSCTSVNIL